MHKSEQSIGVGLRIPHHSYFREQRPAIGWLEVHSENYFLDARLREELIELAVTYPVSLHGVGLSLGSPDPLDRHHLERLGSLVSEVNPMLVSEHLSWSSAGGVHFNDLLPMPYTEMSLSHFAERVDAVQQFLGRQILIENPSSYLRFSASTLEEWVFFAALPERCGCGLLLDINNVYVSAHNHGFDAADYLDSVPFEHVKEIHLAGHSSTPLIHGQTILIDDHGSAVPEPVWKLFQETIARHGPRPTLIEWDTDLPEPPVLLAEAAKALALLEGASEPHRSLGEPAL